MSAIKTIGKNLLWGGLRPFKSGPAWPWRVRSGPAKGARLVLDLRYQGSYWLGTYDDWILDRLSLKTWLKPGDVAWDCGTYVGYYAAVFRKLVGSEGRILAFEASLRNYECVKMVPTLNSWTNVEVIHRAVGPDHSTIKFAGNLRGTSGPVGLTKEFGDKDLEIEHVPCSGVDELVEELGYPLPDFIKFDLETAEEQALHNGKNVFSGKRPILLLEVHGEPVVQSVNDFLTTYSYLAWDILEFDRAEASPIDGRGTMVDVLKSNTLVCLPEERAEQRLAVAPRKN